MTRDTRRTRVILAVLLAGAFSLITVDARGDGTALVDLRRAAAALFAPAQQAATAIVRPVAGFVASMRQASTAQARIAELERENDALRLDVRTSEDAHRRAGELDGLLRLAGVGQYRVLPARIVALGPAQDFAATVTIDAGQVDGLTVDQTVVNGDGLVGRVKTVARTTATVVLAVDPTSAVGVRQEGTGEIGFAGGRGLQSLLHLVLLDPRSPLAKGDRLVTRGGAVFVAGVPVGEVVSVQARPGALTREATVAPFVDFTALDVVGVVVEPPRRDPRDAVLPRRPAGTSGDRAR
ncbi:MAG: rod shape-determining protein MreC [Actinomycetota bacterium]|nr:rod shape-determining protein MreC [Actinomycetota bacterium]